MVSCVKRTRQPCSGARPTPARCCRCVSAGAVTRTSSRPSAPPSPASAPASLVSRSTPLGTAQQQLPKGHSHSSGLIPLVVAVWHQKWPRPMPPTCILYVSASSFQSCRQLSRALCTSSPPRTRVLTAILHPFTHHLALRPRFIRRLFAHVQRAASARYPENKQITVHYSVIGGFIFLRFICSAIFTPVAYGVVGTFQRATTTKGQKLFFSLEALGSRTHHRHAAEARGDASTGAGLQSAADARQRSLLHPQRKVRSAPNNHITPHQPN